MEKSKVTIGLIAVNAIVFFWLAWQQESLLMDSAADQFALLSAGANLNPFTLDGQYWRLFTSMFLHGGIVHLLFNLFGLGVVGWSLEREVGSIRFALIYFICGLVAGLTSLAVNVFVVSVGASGAILGVFGYVLAAEIIATGNDRGKLVTVFISFLIFLVINVIIMNYFAADVAGHIGGMVAGVALALLHLKLKVLSGIPSLVVVLVVIPLAIVVMPKGQVQYYHLFSELVAIERKENNVLSTIRNESSLRDSLLMIKDRWDSLATRSQSMAFVKSKAIAEDTSLFKLQIAMHRRNTLYRAKVLDQSYIYLDSIEVMFQQFDTIPKFHFVPIYELPPQEELQPEPEATKQPQYEQTRVFFDSLWKEMEDPTKHVYYRVGARDSLGRWQGRVRDYYRNGQIQMKGDYTNNLRDGVFIYYSERSTYQSAGRYRREDPVGKWEEFHWSGGLAEETFYDGRVFTRNTWDSLGRPLVVNGFGKQTQWYGNGVIAEEGSYVNGRRDGYWKGFYKDGTPYYEELYRDNELIRGVSITKEGKRFVYDQTSQYPVPEGGMQAFRKFELLNKKKEFTWSGSVKVVFDVAVDGSMTDFTILDSSCPECNAEAIRLVKEGPRWRCGVSHGHKKVSGRGYVEIQF